MSFALIFSVTLAKPLTVSGLKAGRWLGLASRLMIVMDLSAIYCIKPSLIHLADCTIDTKIF